MNFSWRKNNKEIHSAAKRLVRRYIRRRKPRLLHTCPKELNLEKLKTIAQTSDYKPVGLWYGIADSWIDWCLGEDYGGIHKYIYELIIDETKILKIDNIEKFEAFEREHKDLPEWEKKRRETTHPWETGINGVPDVKGAYLRLNSINYERVASNFSGIEISPYLWEKRMESMWYYGWDCASGCIWKPDAIKGLRLFAYLDDKKGDFIKTSLQPDKTRV